MLLFIRTLFCDSSVYSADHCGTVLVFGTELGCAIRATGSNPNMARAQGINTNACKILGLMLSNGLVALASGLYAQYQGFADVNMGRGAIVIDWQRLSLARCCLENFGEILLLLFNSGIRCHYLLSGASGRAVDGTEFE